jgi:hypothetical protein
VKNTGFVVCLVLAAGLGGCATVTRGTTEKVQMVSDPPGASVSTTIGMTCAATPCTLDVPRKKEFTTTFMKPGFAQEDVAVKSKLSTKGGVGMAANMLLPGGTVGLFADAVSGAGLDHVPNPVSVKLRPLGRHARRSPARRHPTS